MTRALGVDPGERRVGLAMSDEDGAFAHPFSTLDGATREALAAQLAQIARDEHVRVVVLGLPLLMNGQEGPAARKARKLAEALETHLPPDVRVVLWDERLTTVSATRQLRASGVKGRKQRQVIDQAAATLLLQSYLDSGESREGGG